MLAPAALIGLQCVSHFLRRDHPEPTYSHMRTSIPCTRAFVNVLALGDLWEASRRFIYLGDACAEQIGTCASSCSGEVRLSVV